MLSRTDDGPIRGCAKAPVSEVESASEQRSDGMDNRSGKMASVLSGVLLR
jgi:hypothetical protein